MPDANMQDFGKRLDRIGRKHAKLSRGYVTSVNHDGLIIARPRARGRRLPWRGMMFILVVAISIKVLMYWQMGAGDYEAMVARFQAGNEVEMALSYILFPDTVTVLLADILATLESA